MVFQESFKGVSRKIEVGFNGVFSGVQEYLKEVQRMFERIFKGFFLGSFNEVSTVFQGKLKVPLRDL